MEKIRKYLLRNKLIRYSGIIFIGSNIANVINFIFYLAMARLLNPSQFGDLIVIFSVLIIVSIPAEIITKTVTRFIAENRSTKRYYLFSIYKKITVYSLAGGILLSIFILLFSGYISSFLKIIDLKSVVIIIAVFPLFLASSVISGFLQGKHYFTQLSFMTVISAVVKLVGGITLVLAGFFVSGAVFAYVIGSGISFLYGFLLINKQLKDNTAKESLLEKRIDLSKVVVYGRSIFLSSIILAIYGQIDIILVKHYLDPVSAGQYASLITIGRLILYGAGPVLMVMFPLISAENKGSDKNPRIILKTAIKSILVLSVFFLLAFGLFPEILIKSLVGKQYLAIKYYLLPMGFIVMFYTISQAFTNYFLATHRNKFIYPLLFSLAIIFGGIIINHRDIYSMLKSLFAGNLILVMTYWILYRRT
jgi:O-antigen/teichoic acid export membrane protein